MTTVIEAGRCILREWRLNDADALVRHANDVLGLERVQAVVNTRNQPSARVLEKSGYVLEGTMRHAAIKEGVLLDRFMYAALKAEWPR
jgi:RimJ/RimL family protein N-acetyltransferase